MAGLLNYFGFGQGGYDPNQQVNTTGTNLPNVFMTPDLYSAGLLSDQNVQNQLQQQATKTGGILSLVDFATRPRNLRAGSVIPYLGEAYKTGFGGAQNVYGTGLNQLLRQQLLASKDENKLYTVDGALVDREGNVVYQKEAKPEQLSIGALDKTKFTADSWNKFIDAGGTPQASKLLISSEGDSKLTEGQAKARTFANRMSDATNTFNSPVLDDNGNPLIDSQGNVQTLENVAGRPEYIRENIPIFGNWATTTNRQRYKQAQENWVTANLRKESGAVIGEEEMEQEIRKWFPKTGDDDETVRQKAIARRTAEQGMREEGKLDVKATQSSGIPSGVKVTPIR